MNENEYRIENSIILHGTPDELERYALAQQDQQEAVTEQGRMIEIALSRSAISGYQDKCDPDEEAIIAQMPENIRGALRAMYPEELHEFAELHMRRAKAIMIEQEVLRAVASRVKKWERE